MEGRVEVDSTGSEETPALLTLKPENALKEKTLFVGFPNFVTRLETLTESNAEAEGVLLTQRGEATLITDVKGSEKAAAQVEIEVLHGVIAERKLVKAQTLRGSIEKTRQ